MSGGKPPGAQPSGTALPTQPWTVEIAPRFVALFLLIVFFDRLAPSTLAVAGLAPAVRGAVVAAALCLGLLYYAPALWGLQARRSFPELAARTFGSTGARWLATGLLALAHAAWFAVAVAYADDLTLRGLVLAGLLDPSELGPDGGAVYQATAILWIVPAVALGPTLVHFVAAVMYVYMLVPALLLAGFLAWSLRWLPEYAPPPAGPAANWQAFAAMIQLIFAYFATAGAGAAAWGAVSRDRRDIRIGGLIGVLATPVVVVTVALLTIAGHLARHRGLAEPTYVAVLTHNSSGAAACAFLMIHALALLGPACYMPADLVRSCGAAFPQTPRWIWPLALALAAWPLVASRSALRLELMFGLIGGSVAPLVGALAADCLRDRGAWIGPTPGWSRTATLAWAAGAAVGLAPYLAPSFLGALQPAAVLAFSTALALRLLLASFPNRNTPTAPTTPQPIAECSCQNG